MVLLIVLLGIAAYIGVGVRFVSPQYFTAAFCRKMNKFQKDYPSLYNDSHYRNQYEREYRFFSYWESFGILFVWPIVGAGYLLCQGFKKTIDNNRPLTNIEHDEKLDAAEKRIRELERELNIAR